MGNNNAGEADLEGENSSPDISSTTLASTPAELNVANDNVEGIEIHESKYSSSDLLKSGFLASTPSIGLTDIVEAISPSLDPDEFFLCQVCFDRYRFDESKHIQLNCGHKYCRDCLDNWFTSKIIEAEMNLKCFAFPPDDQGGVDPNGEQCNVSCSFDEVKQIVDRAVYEKWERFKRQHDNADLRECPWPGCSYEQCGSAKQPKMICGRCKKEYCFVHSNAHPGMTCRMYERSKRNEFRANVAAAGDGKKSAKCPGCGLLTVKNGGCNHMTCSKCHTHWCWVCRADISDGVDKHYRTTWCSQFPEHQFPFCREEAPSWYRWAKGIFLVYVGLIVGPPIFILHMIACLLTCCVCPIIFITEENEHEGCRYFTYFMGKWYDKVGQNAAMCIGGCIMSPIFFAFGCVACVLTLPCMCCAYFSKPSYRDTEDFVKDFCGEVTGSCFMCMGGFVAACIMFSLVTPMAAVCVLFMCFFSMCAYKSVCQEIFADLDNMG